MLTARSVSEPVPGSSHNPIFQTFENIPLRKTASSSRLSDRITTTISGTLSTDPSPHASQSQEDVPLGGQAGIGYRTSRFLEGELVTSPATTFSFESVGQPFRPPRLTRTRTEPSMPQPGCSSHPVAGGMNRDSGVRRKPLPRTMTQPNLTDLSSSATRQSSSNSTGTRTSTGTTRDSYSTNSSSALSSPRPRQGSVARIAEAVTITKLTWKTSHSPVMGTAPSPPPSAMATPSQPPNQAQSSRQGAGQADPSPSPPLAAPAPGSTPELAASLPLPRVPPPQRAPYSSPPRSTSLPVMRSGQSHAVLGNRRIRDSVYAVWQS